MNNKICYQVYFIGVRTFVRSPIFKKLKSAENWLERNKHRVVEDCQYIKYDSTKTDCKYTWHHTDNDYKLGRMIDTGWCAPMFPHQK
jgi:hypothetical protein